MTNFEKVGLFMKTFGQEVKNRPSLGSDKINKLRISLISEELEELKQAIANKDLKEVILATNTTVEGEATAHYISEMVKAHGLKVSRIAHGVPMGGELEFVNSMTIVHALDDRKVI